MTTNLPPPTHPVHAPTVNSRQPQPSAAARIRTTEAGDPMEALMWTFWLLGNVLAITLLGVLLNQELGHQDIASTPAQSRSAPDVGEA
ncbi:hypothetical protein ACIQI7_15730 [Kitasatospora sp. NPDC092039]|uniref:hypothetical protein n=1 Tax=Kitasatospora sp. NPDC092039 TaxID=3364086 RepID=UPI0038065557